MRESLLSLEIWILQGPKCQIAPWESLGTDCCYVLTEIFMHGCSSVGPMIERVSYILCIHSLTQAAMGKMNGIFFFLNFPGRPHSYVFMEAVIVLASWNPGDITVISGSVCFSDHGDHRPQVLILTVGDRRD